ncbi:MAG: siderophore-interacting protein [Gammaproteobacteria bacterium]
MAKPAPMNLDVIRSEYLTPNMLRVTLGGSELKNFPDDQESAYVKLLFPQLGEPRPLMRTYTVSQQRSDEIAIDFALHGAQGPASMWAQNARAGDQISLAGPGPKKLINLDADWFLFAGDMTALPSIAVNLKQLPSDALGYVVIEVVSEADIQSLTAPENIEIHWVINTRATTHKQPILERIKQLSWLPGEAAMWAACEFQCMRELRAYFKQERQLPKSHLYISSYWKSGNTEDQHKVAKQADAQAA